MRQFTENGSTAQKTHGQKPNLNGENTGGENPDYEGSGKTRVKKQPPNSNTGVRFTSAINLDWLEVSFKGLIPKSIENQGIIDKGDGFKLDSRESNGTKHFKKRYIVRFEGEKIGRLLADPRSPVIDSDLVQFKFENHILYREDWKDLLDRLAQSYQWHYNNITRLDIALDGPFTNRQWIANNVLTGKYRIKGNTQFICFGWNNQECRHETFQFGSSSSDKRLKVYDKNKELEHSNKQYIREFWKENGLEPSEMERIEIQLNSKAIKRIPDFDWNKLESPEYLKDLMREYCEDWFVFIETDDSQANVSRRKAVSGIDWDQIGGKRLGKEKTNRPNKTYQAKQFAKSLHTRKTVKEEAGMLSDQEAKFYERLLKDVLEENNIWGWYYSHYDRWEQELKRTGKI